MTKAAAAKSWTLHSWPDGSHRSRPDPAPAYMQGKVLHEWFQIPGSNLSSAVPSNTFSGTAAARVTAWNGAALKRTGSIYVVGAAGGHADYSGNDVVSIDLSQDSPAWVMRRDTTPQNQVVNSCAVYLDYRRAATHTYYCSQFIDAMNRLAIFPAPGMGDSQYNTRTSDNQAFVDSYSGDKTVCTYSLDDEDWDADLVETTGQGAIADWPGGDQTGEGESPGDFTACLCCMHPLTGDVYYARNGESSHRLWKWTRASNTWSQITANEYWHRGYAASAIDPARGRMLICGDFGGTAAPLVVDLATAADLDPTFGGLGAEELEVSGYPGLVFDEDNDRYILATNTNPITLLAINASTWEVSELETTGTAPAQRQNGILNSIQYAPELKALVICNSHAGNMHMLRVA